MIRNGIGRASRQDVFYLLHSLFKNTAKLIAKLGKVLPGKFAEKTTDSICEALTKVRMTNGHSMECL
jgi:hypothetical protein